MTKAGFDIGDAVPSGSKSRRFISQIQDDDY
jgi:hypothetical protein